MEEQQVTESNPKQTQVKEAERTDSRAHEAKQMSTKIAMFMALVAMLGAVTAYRAALAEQDTLRYERRLQQGEILELVHRQELLSKLSSRTRYENSAALHTPTADGDQQQAGKAVAPTPPQAALKKLQAEEELAHVRSLGPYLDYFRVDLPYGLEPSIAIDSAKWLRDLGFDTAWEVPKKNEPFPSIWEKLDKQVEKGRNKVIYLATAVVLFVVALAFLTFAQLTHEAPRREKTLIWMGGLLALAGLVVAMWNDRASWPEFVLFSAGFLILAWKGTPLARKFHFAARTEEEERCAKLVSSRPAEPAGGESGESDEEEPVHPAEVEPALFAGMRLHTAPVAHKFGRFVISIIALSAVLSALSGYFYSRAAVRSSTAVSAALENQTELFRTNSRQVTVWNYLVGRVATAEDYHLRYEAARQRLELAKENPALLSQKEATDLMQQRQQSLEKFEKKEPEAHKLMTGELGPEQDVNFPWKMVITQSYHEPAKVLARWSANNEMSLGYQREATTFLALLTLFAIALYLLGQALGMGRTSASFILVLFACCLVFAGVLGGVFTRVVDKAIVLKPPSPECRIMGISDNDLVELAAEHFANGWVLYSGSEDDPAGFAQAAKEFGCAAQIRPTFAAANLYFARATNRANTPQLNEGGYVSLISKDTLEKVAEAERRAGNTLREQGFAPPVDVVGDYGFHTYAVGLVKGDRRMLDRGEDATRRALDLDEKNLVTHFNLGLAQLANGQEQEALKTYQETIAMGEPDAAMIGGAITDLDVFRQYCTGLDQADYCKRFETTDLPTLKSELVAAAWPAAKGRTLANSGIKLTGLTLWGSTGGLGWSGNVENPAPDAGGKTQDSLAILWYAYNNEWNAWRVLPAISERVNPSYYAQGYAKIFYSVLQASDARICLQSGKYRAEFYVDGELTDTKEISLEHEKVKPGVFPDLNVAFCYPSSWQRWKSRDPHAVWTRGYIGGDHTRGAFVFSFFDPQQDGEEAGKERGLRRAENILQKEGLTAGPVGQTRLYECAGLQGSPRHLMAAFTDGGGVSLAKAWTTKEGLVNVLVVVDKHPPGPGPDTHAPARQDCEILLSATTVQP